MAARTKARKRALDLLFEAEQRELPLLELLRERLVTPGTQAPLPQYSVELVEGVAAHTAEIDDVLATYSQGWTLPRMPAVDRGILRLGAYEVIWADAVPDPVAISEWVALATDLSTDESPKFINGLLARVAEVKDTIG